MKKILLRSLYIFVNSYSFLFLALTLGFTMFDMKSSKRDQSFSINGIYPSSDILKHLDENTPLGIKEMRRSILQNFDGLKSVNISRQFLGETKIKIETKAPVVKITHDTINGYVYSDKNASMFESVYTDSSDLIHVHVKGEIWVLNEFNNPQQLLAVKKASAMKDPFSITHIILHYGVFNEIIAYDAGGNEIRIFTKPNILDLEKDISSATTIYDHFCKESCPIRSIDLRGVRMIVNLWEADSKFVS